jgi:hypothetical protein
MKSMALSDEEVVRGARGIFFRLDVTREQGKFVVVTDGMRRVYRRQELDAFLEGYCLASQKAWAEKYSEVEFSRARDVCMSNSAS